MDTWNDRLEEWVRAHPWAWGAVGSLVMGAFVLGLQVLVDRHPIEDALPLAGALVALWFVALGLRAKWQARG